MFPFVRMQDLRAARSARGSSPPQFNKLGTERTGIERSRSPEVVERDWPNLRKG